MRKGTTITIAVLLLLLLGAATLQLVLASTDDDRPSTPTAVTVGDATDDTTG